MSEFKISETLARKAVETNALISCSKDWATSILTPDGMTVIA